VIGILPFLLTARSAPGTRQPGNAFVYVKTPAGVAAGLPLTNVFSFEVHRAANRVGTFSFVVPADDRLDIDGSPLVTDIVSGWTVSILQESNTPFGAPGVYMVKDGVIERREYLIADGGQAINFAGSFRAVSLTRQQIHDTLSYEDQAVGAIAEGVAGEVVLTPNGVSTTVKVDFSGGTRYAALLTLGELARLTLRENWDGNLEYTRIDGAPDSGITLINVEQAGPELIGV
jgi:hypothetical protein